MDLLSYLRVPFSNKSPAEDEPTRTPPNPNAIPAAALNQQLHNAPQATATTSDDPAAQFKALGVQTLSEWDAGRTAQKATSISKAPPASRTTTNPHPHPAATPVPVGGPRTTEHIQRLYQLCQVRGIVPEFDYSKRGELWAAKLTLGSEVVEAEGPYASKKEGKEVCAERGCEIAERVPVLGSQASDGGAQGGAEEPQSLAGAKRELPLEENWVGLLLEFCNANSTAQPIYQEYRLGHQIFAASLELASPHNAHFGSSTTAYNSKKVAKTAAARDAICWLRERGFMGESGGPPIRKKALRESLGSGAGVGGSAVISESSCTQKINDLRDTLGLSNMEYRLTPLAGTALFSGAAYFENEPALRGPIGEVHNVFGRKNAKEECAKEVVRVLTAIKEERLRRLEA